MKRLNHGLVVLAVFAAAPLAAADEPETIPLDVLYLSRNQDEGRGAAFVDFLSSQFARCTTAKRADFKPDLLEGIDVVVLDWPQSERTPREAPSPLGPLERWETPTVLLGSAGLLVSRPWNVIGGAG